MWPSRRRYRFEALVRAYSADLYRFAYWLARDRGVAEDLVQECFARAWKHFDQLQDDLAAKRWLFAILRNENARLYAKPRPEQDAVSLDEVEVPVDSAVTWTARLDMDAALEQLPEVYREPLLLQVLGGFSCAEIAALMSTSENNVMQRVSRARRAMRELIEPGTRLREKK